MSNPALTRPRGDFELSCTAEFYFDKGLRSIRRRKIALGEPTKQIHRHQRLHLSNASYIFIALFVILHTIGAHYTYAKMPVGLWAKDFLGFSRNHADRVAHFGFGFLLAFPVRELLLRVSGIRRGWSFWLPPAIILAISGFFEILESIVAEIVAPGKGVEWLGGQGDEWDAQNDMLSALLGSLTMMAAVLLTNGKRKAR